MLPGVASRVNTNLSDVIKNITQISVELRVARSECSGRSMISNNPARRLSQPEPGNNLSNPHVGPSRMAAE
jgi:hypothetical protein